MLNFQGYFSLNLFENVINWYYPIKTKKPSRSVSYWYLNANFDYPTKWKRYENKSLTEYSKIVNQIKDNNKKIVKEYIDYLKKEDRLYKLEYIENFLLKFLNDFLLRHRISLVTSNLAEAVVYLYLDLINGADDPNLDDAILVDFYRFLTYTGCIRKLDADKLDFDLNRTFYKVCLDGDLLNADEQDSEINIESIFQNTVDLENTHQKKEEKNNLLSLVKRPVEDKTILDRNIVFEINAKIVKAKPVIDRTFKIGGLTSFKDLQKALIMMFGLSEQKIYSLYNPRTQNTYSSVSETEILELKSKDQLEFNYNNGQYLFKVSVRKRTHLSETTPMQIYPQVISGKGNINQLQDNKIDKKVDIESINEKLRVKFVNKLH